MTFLHAENSWRFGLGSITSLTNSSGAPIETYTYDSGGKTVASAGALINPFQYTGREFDSETGLYYYRSRYLDASTGRFLSEDSTRILLVDDHEIVRKGVRMLFTNNDSCEVCGEAQNGLKAIRMVAELSPDVVILDLTMPGTTGFETVAKIRQIAPSIRIIFFTIHEIPASAWWVGADACVSKSSALEELTLKVNRVLQSRGNFQLVE